MYTIQKIINTTVHTHQQACALCKPNLTSLTLSPPPRPSPYHSQGSNKPHISTYVQNDCVIMFREEGLSTNFIGLVLIYSIVCLVLLVYNIQLILLGNLRSLFAEEIHYKKRKIWKMKIHQLTATKHYLHVCIGIQILIKTNILKKTYF